jgi:hypothetical protein
MNNTKKVIYLTRIEVLEAAMADLLKSLITPKNRHAIHSGINQFLLSRLCDECFDINEVEQTYPHLYSVIRYIAEYTKEAQHD